MQTNGRVPVLGSDNTILSYTHPARARKLVKRKKAYVVNVRPFTIRLVKDPIEEMKMQQAKTPIVTNFTEYFREERDVYVQNRGNTQISLQFEVAHGRIEAVLLPRGKKPLNLTQLVPFHALKNSIDLRKLINRRPPVLALLDEAEFIDYYERLAKSRSTSFSQELDEAQQCQADLQNKKTYTDKDSVRRKTIEEVIEERKDEPMTPDEKVTARVVGLCANVGNDVDEKDRIPAREMLAELQDMELTTADLEYLLGHGQYTSVKKFVQKQLDERNPAEEIE